MKSRAERSDVTTTAIHRLCLYCGKLIIPGKHACEETLKNIEEMGKCGQGVIRFDTGVG